jgi:hypothetical protein
VDIGTVYFWSVGFPRGFGPGGAFCFSPLERRSLQKEGICAIDPHSRSKALEAWEAHLHGFHVKVKGGVEGSVGSKVTSTSDNVADESDVAAVGSDGN